MNPVKVRNVEIGTGIPKICVPIVGVTREEILEAGKKICHIGADVVEWRVDWYEDICEFAKVEETMKELRDVLGDMPVLFTFRTSREGGEKAIEVSEYVELNEKAARNRLVQVVDVAEHVVAVRHSIDNDAHGADIIDLVDGLVLGIHFAVDRVNMLDAGRNRVVDVRFLQLGADAVLNALQEFLVLLTLGL